MSSATPSNARMEHLLAGQVHARGRYLFRVAFNILHDGPAAEDVCQQAFLRAWEHQNRFRAREALGAWLTQTVVNEALSVCRRRKRESRAVLRQAEITPAWDGDAAGNQEQREKVLLEVARLAEPIRLVVALRLLENMPGKKVAEILDCSAVEVSRRLHQGMEILRERLTQTQTITGEL